MKKMKLVMIGNGMAGVRALEELLKIAPEMYDITVFGTEPHPNYNRILLSPVLAGEQTLDEIVRNPVTMSPSLRLRDEAPHGRAPGFCCVVNTARAKPLPQVPDHIAGALRAFVPRTDD